MAGVTLKNISKTYDKTTMVVDDLNLEIYDKEFVVLVGPSGCGKSTTLRMIAGLEDITKGELYIGDRLVNDVAPKDRDIAMVFQNYALYPHMTVFENMAFALKLRKVPKKEIEQRVEEAAGILGIMDYLKRKPKQLSGGQRQRVAIGRSIVREPQVFLMDEPLSNLDAKLRNQMRAELIKLHKRLDTTFVYVTHDQIEAMTLGSRIIVMKDGFVQQVGTPYEIFENPSNMFVAGFIGTPQMNFFSSAQLLLEDGHYAVSLFGKKYRVSEEKQKVLMANAQNECGVIAGIRPEDIEVATGKANVIRAKIDVKELMGSEVYLHVDILNGEHDKGENIHVQEPGLEAAANTVCIRVKAHQIPEDAQVLDIAPLPDKIHLFDKETRVNICL